MAKLIEVESDGHGPDVQFLCPGCNMHHGVWTKNQDKAKNWAFNGDFEKPTFSPSIAVRYPVKGFMNVCHSFVKEGKIQFLSDCTHSLKGQTVELPELE